MAFTAGRAQSAPLMFNEPFEFVALLGVIALAGMAMRNGLF
jgi:multidrug efflux pump subunit AcrB